MQIVVIHNGANVGSNAVAGNPPTDWAGPIIDIVDQLQDTTIDLVLAGHTHRIANTVVGHIPVAEGINAGGSYSVAQLMVQDGDVAWVSPSTRVAKNLGVARRADVQAIVDQANAETAELRNQVIGTQSIDILRDPTRLHESAMGNMVADSMRLHYPGVEAALTNSGGLRDDIIGVETLGGEAVNEITWGEVFAVLPFGNRTVIETLTGDQLSAALLNGLQPACNPSFTGGTGRFPQVAGLAITFTCTTLPPGSGSTPVLTGLWKAPDGPGGALTPIGPTDTVRIVTNDFMFTGGDGYTALGWGHERAAARRRSARRDHQPHHGQLAGRAGRRGTDRRPLTPARPVRGQRDERCASHDHSSLIAWGSWSSSVIVSAPGDDARGGDKGDGDPQHYGPSRVLEKAQAQRRHDVAADDGHEDPTGHAHPRCAAVGQPGGEQRCHAGEQP